MSGGAYVARASTLTQRGLILGYAALSRKQIEQGIARLSDAIDDAVDDPSADVNALFVRASLPRPAPPKATAPRPHAIALSGPQLSAATGSNGQAPPPPTLDVRRSAQSGQRHGRGEQNLPVSDQGAERAAAVERHARSRQAVPARSHLRAGAARRPDRPRRSEMGQEGPVRDAHARRESGPGRNLARSRIDAAYRPAGRSAGRFRATRRSPPTGRRSRNSSGSCCRPCAPRRRWCARPAGISWTSRTTSSR